MNLGSTSVFLVAVSFVAPIATPSYVEPHVANAAYVQPVATTSYMEVKVQAEVTFPGVQTYTKNVTDSFGFVDVKVIDMTLNKTDSVTLASSGTIISQDYADLTYFAGDYVGSSISFT